MNIRSSLTVRGGSLVTALAFTVALLAPLASTADVSAATMGSRKITVSSTADGDTSTDANGVAVTAGSGGNGAQARHTFDFTMSTNNANVRSVLLQYCDTPLLDTACDAPEGMDASALTGFNGSPDWGAQDPTLNTSTVANTGGIFTTSPCSGTTPFRANCILLSRADGALSGTPSLNVSFGSAGSNWIKNPTETGNYFVRIYTFSDTNYTTQIDQGAVAFSINTAIDITAKVQEKLNFSVAAAKNQDPGTGCAALTGLGAIQLGAGGVLDTQQAFDNHTYFRLSTNAANGTSVQYSGDTLKTASGGNSIAAAPTTGATSTVGAAQFGLALDTSDSAQHGHSFTNLTATSPYGGGAGTITNAGTASFAFNTASMTTPVEIASAAPGTTVSCDTGSVRYIANISPITRPGVYRTTINYFALPTF